MNWIMIHYLRYIILQLWSLSCVLHFYSIYFRFTRYLAFIHGIWRFFTWQHCFWRFDGWFDRLLSDRSRISYLLVLIIFLWTLGFILGSGFFMSSFRHWWAVLFLFKLRRLPWVRLNWCFLSQILKAIGLQQAISSFWELVNGTPFRNQVRVVITFSFSLLVLL